MLLWQVLGTPAWIKTIWPLCHQGYFSSEEKFSMCAVLFNSQDATCCAQADVIPTESMGFVFGKPVEPCISSTPQDGLRRTAHELELTSCIGSMGSRRK